MRIPASLRRACKAVDCGFDVDVVDAVRQTSMRERNCSFDIKIECDGGDDRVCLASIYLHFSTAMLDPDQIRFTVRLRIPESARAKLLTMSPPDDRAEHSWMSNPFRVLARKATPNDRENRKRYRMRTKGHGSGKDDDQDGADGGDDGDGGDHNDSANVSGIMQEGRGEDASASGMNGAVGPVPSLEGETEATRPKSAKNRRVSTPPPMAPLPAVMLPIAMPVPVPASASGSAPVGLMSPNSAAAMAAAAALASNNASLPATATATSNANAANAGANGANLVRQPPLYVYPYPYYMPYMRQGGAAAGNATAGAPSNAPYPAGYSFEEFTQPMAAGAAQLPQVPAVSAQMAVSVPVPQSPSDDNKSKGES
jgi:hypothetical protein